MSRTLFLDALERNNKSGTKVFGTATSIVCQELMDVVGAGFPEGHLDAEKMAALAMAGHSILRLHAVMPLFSVCHEASAMGCNVNWGGNNMMPESGRPIFQNPGDITIPEDLLKRPGCAVPLKAISLLKKRLGDDAAVCGKVFGPWTQAYHYFGIENFLMMTIDNPEQVKQILNKLLPITIAFAGAQIEAGADCLLLADHATSDLCGPKAYEEFLKPVHTYLANEIDAPLILHICGDTADRVAMIAETGLACFHWDTKTGPSEKVRKLAGNNLSLMGGVSNYILLRGSKDDVAGAVTEAARSGIDIIGPECAVSLQTPLENLKMIAKE